MNIVSTSDLSLELLESFNQTLPSELQGRVDERQMFFKSVDTPSWLTLFASLPWWTQALTSWAGVYLLEITKEAAKDSWRNRAVAVTVAKRAGVAVASPLAKALAELGARLPQRTTIHVGTPAPDEHFGATLRVSLQSVEDTSVDLMFFAMHLPALQVLINRIAKQGVLGAVILEIQANGDLAVEWRDSENLESHRQVLALPDAV